MVDVDNLKDKKESIESEDSDPESDPDSDLEDDSDEPTQLQSLLLDEYFMATYQECNNLITGEETKSIRDESYICKISISNLKIRKQALFSSFLEHKDRYLQTSITTINDIDLEDDPFKILEHDDNEYILDGICIDNLFEKLKHIRLQKKKLYKSISDETKYTKIKPGNCSNFQDLVHRILYISNVLNQKIQHFKQTPQKRGHIKTINNFDRYILTKKQFQCILMWFMQYIPNYCFNKMLEIDPNYHIKFLFVAAIINQCFLASQINAFDTDRIEFEPMEEIPLTEEQKDEWLIKTSIEYKNQFCYFLNLGSFIIYDKKSIGHLKHILKIGESHSLKNGIKQRFTNHINSKNFMDVTVINIYRSSNPKIMENKLHYKAYSCHLNGKLWNKGIREETELFAFGNMDHILGTLNIATQIEQEQDHLSKEQELRDKISHMTDIIISCRDLVKKKEDLYENLITLDPKKDMVKIIDIKKDIADITESLLHHMDI